jgi:hypothetical protein
MHSTLEHGKRLIGSNNCRDDLEILRASWEELISGKQSLAVAYKII